MLSSSHAIDDADDTTYDAHLTATIQANKTYYLAMRDYDSASGWFFATNDGTTCSRAGLGTATPESDQYGLDFMAHATCSQYQQHEWYYCDSDGQMHFADDGVR